MQKNNMVGLSVAVNYQGNEWSKGYGFADLENQVPAISLSAYRLASITKPMTAVGVLLLAQQGKIDLDAEVQEYVPYFPRKKWPVTIRQLLGHLSGISHYRDYLQESGTTQQMRTEEALAIFSDWELLHQPSSKYQYTTYGYNLLGAVIEGASGRSYEEFMREQVWDPLGMKNTQLDHLFRLIPNRVSGYRRENNEIVNVRPVNTSLKFAGGGTRSTVIDMLRFARGLSQNKLLNRTFLDSMWTSMATTEGRWTDYGMGWSISALNGRYMVQHGGGQEGTRTFLMHLPEHDLTLSVASNCEQTNPGEVARRLVVAFLNEPSSWPVIYTGLWKDDVRQEVLRHCYNEGLSYFDRYDTAYQTEAEVVQHAFERVNRYGTDTPFSVPPDSVQTIVEKERHPGSGSIYRVAGSYMADKIIQRDGRENIDALYRQGPLAFFESYRKAGNGESLNPALSEMIQEWQTVLEKIWTGSLQNLTIDYTQNPEELEAKLKSAFTGYEIYPDFTDDFFRAAEEALRNDLIDRTRRLSEISIRFYPNSDVANAQLGLIQLIDNNPETGLQYLRRALELNPNGAARQSRLNQFAYQLAGMNKIDAGLTVLTTALELNPTVANLYDSQGELFLMKGDTTRSIASYEKALKIDPEFENAQRMLDRIRGSK
jgi:CubicO group peptidase (beta-lactamase class C family)